MLLEVCVDTLAGLRAAETGGADRIELCSALALGGLTPTPGLIAAARHARVPVRVMIRPRAGRFVFDSAELALMTEEIAVVRAAGLEGVVIGAATPDGALDIAALRRLVGAARGLRVTLHRVVDLLADPLDAIEAAVALGIDTILTSGGAPTAAEGAAAIAAMRGAAGDRLTILAGSGVRADSVAALVARTGVRAVHASCGAPTAPDLRAEALGFAPPGLRDTDAGEVARLRAALDALPARG